MTKYGVIYLITNLINGKQYVGQTVVALQLRWKRHCWNCTTNTGRMPISFAIKKYSKNNFKIEVLQECFSLKELNEKELEYANKLNTWSPHGYNLSAGRGSGAMSDLVKAKISKSNTGKKRSAETKKKLSLAHMGQKPSECEIQRRKNFMKGKGPCQKARENSLKACCKTYNFLDPDNQSIVIYNMADFCRKNKLCRSKMSSVATGKRKLHKGYKLNDFQQS